jgi:lipopolysaccharide biosynthesis glycosyltransferase
MKKPEKEEDDDPTFNQGVMIEIFDNKNKAKNKQEVSLAEMFKAKKKEAVLKLDQRKQ